MNPGLILGLSEPDLREVRAYRRAQLPPSFPYGGMENPCLTFVTPTLIAGDRSQANVIVHEISHSWCAAPPLAPPLVC